MYSEELSNIAASIGVLADRVDQDSWAFLRLVQQNLKTQAELVADLERCATFSPAQTTPQPQKENRAWKIA